MARSTKKKTVKNPGPSAAEVEAALTKYQGDFLVCREIHWWVQVGFYYDAEGDVRRLWKCQRCGAGKKNRMTPDGRYVGSTTYTHPEGYKMPGVNRQQVRAESIRRAKVYSSESMMMSKAATGKTKLVLPVRHQRKTKASR